MGCGARRDPRMRSKEEAHDYRYFPEPDLVPLRVDAAWIESVRTALPELPDAKRTRFESAYRLSRQDAGDAGRDARLADYYESTVAAGADPKLAANWILTELLALLNERGLDASQSPLERGSTRRTGAPGEPTERCRGRWRRKCSRP